MTRFTSSADYIRSGFREVGEWVRKAHGVSSFFEEAWGHFESGRRREIFNVTLEKLGMSPSEELIRSLLSVYRDHVPEICLLPDSEDCLREVAGKAFLGIISDGAVLGQQRKIERLGLAPRCDHIILTESIGVEYSKPHPRAFMDMQQIANCGPQACVYIADNPIKDFTSPKRLGWRTIRIRRPGGIHCTVGCSDESQPAIEIQDLRQIPALLKLDSSRIDSGL